ncbi:MAG: GTP-binding protein [SAR324 cluster bacterium]|nr:GTP-binding protein [SAR324 cluster bacterium]
MEKERLNIVTVGHVDHGKSTVIGRLLADTGSLPEGKLQEVRDQCARNAKPFEFAFLLDALKDEQEQGITIDVARCFFETEKRHYIIIDAPGHIEFLKNMVTGAAAAEVAVIVIDAKEGIQENTKRHGYLVSMLGLKKVIVVVNKMDLVDYAEDSFNNTETEYRAFLKKLDLDPIAFIPISGFQGENMVKPSDKMTWFKGNHLIGQFDALVKDDNADKTKLPFRMPLQGVYKFTEEGDDRRIFAGTVQTGSAKVGDEVVFLPSQKRSKIKTIELFNADTLAAAEAGRALGLTLETQVYVQPGELLVRVDETQPVTARRFKSNIFWMGKAPLILGKKYKLKIGAKRLPVRLIEVVSIVDASDIGAINKTQVDRHDVAECIFEAVKPIVFDLAGKIDQTGRFVLVDDYEIAGGGIITEEITVDKTLDEEHVKLREESWVRGWVNSAKRAERLGHKATSIVFTGDHGLGKRKMAAALEKILFDMKLNPYFMAYTNLNLGLDSDLEAQGFNRSEEIRRLGELSHLMTDAGMIFITVVAVEDGFDLELLKQINGPTGLMVINVGENRFTQYQVDLTVEPHENEGEVTAKIIDLLKAQSIFV